MTRREAREQALCLVFERMFHDEEPVSEIVELAREARELEPDPFAVQLAEGTCGHSAELDALIEKYAIGWNRERLSKVTLAILRMSIYEIRFVAATPVSVSINEAVELAKKFGGDGDSAFINGILGSVARGEEHAAGKRTSGSRRKKPAEKADSKKGSVQKADVKKGGVQKTARKPAQAPKSAEGGQSVAPKAEQNTGKAQ